jgi:hypothetical protein
MTAPGEEQRLQLLAYQLWEQEGRPEGRHLEHWHEAKRRLHAETQEATPPEAAQDMSPEAAGRELLETTGTPGPPPVSHPRLPGRERTRRV